MTLPLWSALTVVASGYRVSKVTPDGTAWTTSKAGTTGAAEPVWPVTDPWTVTDGSTAWGLASSFRTLTRAGVLTLLTNFRNANPTLLRGVSSSRPKSFTNLDLPGVYIASMDEVITMTGNQLRKRQLSGLTVVAVDIVPDNMEAEARMDVLIDGLVDAMTSGFHAIDSNSVLQPSSVNEIPITEGAIQYLGNLISLGNTFKTEGRT